MLATQRPVAFAAVALAVVLSGQARAQSEPPEEITVRGEKPLQQYRLELEAAREDIVAAYNEANSSDDNDIVCRNERVTGTRMPQRVCRSKAQSEAESSASMALLRAFTHNAGRHVTPLGETPPDVLPQVNASIGAGNAQAGAEMLSVESRAVIEAELETLRKENRQVYRAIVRYLELLDEYNRARGVTVEEQRRSMLKDLAQYTRASVPQSFRAYSSESRARAILETFVHLTLEARTMQFVLCTIELPPRARVARHYGQRAPPLEASQEIGREWFVGGGTLALAVPSVIVPNESNCVLNVNHRLFARLVATRAPFSFDDRLWRRSLQALR